MKPKTHNVAEQFKSFVERIERLDQERVDLSNDMADVYKEVRAADFNPKAMKALISERRRERRDPAAFRSAAELLEQYRDLLDGTDHALTRAPRARSEQSAGAPSPNGPQAPNPPVSVPAEPIPESAAGASTRKDEEPGEPEAHPVPAVRPAAVPDERPTPAVLKPAAEPLPTVTLDDGTTVVPATHLPPPSVMAMMNRKPLPRDSRFEYAQPDPDDGMAPPSYMDRRRGRA